MSKQPVFEVISQALQALCNNFIVHLSDTSNTLRQDIILHDIAIIEKGLSAIKEQVKT